MDAEDVFFLYCVPYHSVNLQDSELRSWIVMHVSLGVLFCFVFLLRRVVGALRSRVESDLA